MFYAHLKVSFSKDTRDRYCLVVESTLETGD